MSKYKLPTNLKDFVLVSPDTHAGSRIFAEVNDRGSVELSDARWRKRSNVHIVSYWGPFRSMKHLESDLNAIEELYEELCGTRFCK